MTRNDRWKRRLTRLARVSPREAVFRLHNLVCTAREFARYRWGSPDWQVEALVRSLFGTRGSRLAATGHTPAARAVGLWLLARLRENASSRFYWSPAVAAELAQRVRELWPDEHRLLMRRAESAREGVVEVFDLNVGARGEGIDWHVDPVGGKPWPRAFWSSIRYLGDTEGRDAKYVWELNRHQHLFDLTRAYAASGDPGFAQCALSHMLDWIATNPPCEGMNWASALEVAIRATAWIWTLHLLLDSDVLDPEHVTAIVAGLSYAGSYIEDHLSVYSSPNTHLLGEAWGLLLLGTYLQELPTAGRWRALGLHLLTAGLVQQTRGDGFHFERSVCYHDYCLEFALHALALARGGRAVVPPGLLAVSHHLLEAAAALTRADGQAPAMGDDDGGHLLRFCESRECHHRGLLAAGAILTGRGDLKHVAAEFSPHALWLLGPDAERMWHELPAEMPPRVANLRASGLVTARTCARSGGDSLFFRVGPEDASGATHGHDDALSIEVCLEGHPVAVDPGTGCYARYPEWRQHFRSGAAHNTLLCASREGPRPIGLFEWSSAPRGRLEWAVQGSSTVFALGTRLDSRARPDHRRAVLWIPGEYVLCVDLLEEEATECWQLGFQFAPARLHLVGDGSARVETQSGVSAMWLLGVPESDSFSLSVHEGETSPPKGWISHSYGRRSPSPSILVRGRSALPSSVASCLSATGRQGAPRSLRYLRMDSGQGWEVETARGCDWVILGTRGRGPIAAEGVQTDAGGLFVRFDRSQRPVSMLAAGGASANVCGRLLRLDPERGTETWLDSGLGVAGAREQR